MAADPHALAEAHWRAVRKGQRASAAARLVELRGLGGPEDAPAEARRALAGALAKAHWDAGRCSEEVSARALLDELRAVCRSAATDEAERFELAKALSTAHWDAVRYGDAPRAARILGELRNLAKRGEATEGQRQALAEALANEVRHHTGPRSDRADAEAPLADLRRLADRPHAPESQREALARALLDLHHGEREGGRVEELRVLAARDAATPAQHLAYVEALQDAPWQTGIFGHRRRQDALLTGVRQAEGAARGAERPITLLGDALVRMHAKVRRAKDDAFADLLLDRLRVLAVQPEATIEQWLALATALGDGLWIAQTFTNRELAEELVEVLHLVTGPVEATVKQRIALAGLLVGAHHRAVRQEDNLVSKELLTLLHAWAVRPKATREEREVLSHGLDLARHHATARRDKALVAKIEAALRALPAASQRAPGASPLQELALGSS